MATHSSILAWKIPWMEEPDGLQSMGSQRVGHNWATPPPSPMFWYLVKWAPMLLIYSNYFCILLLVVKDFLLYWKKQTNQKTWPWLSYRAEDIMMANFMCHLGWAIILRYIIKHYFRCFWEGEACMRLKTTWNHWLGVKQTALSK